MAQDIGSYANGLRPILKITENGVVDVSNVSAVDVDIPIPESEIHSTISSNTACNIFAYVVNGIAVVNATRVYIGGNTSGLAIAIPEARHEPDYLVAFGHKIEYSAAALLEVETPDGLEPQAASVHIYGGDTFIRVKTPGYYTFQLTYPVNP